MTTLNNVRDASDKVLALCKPDSEDIILWQDDSWCFGYELHEMCHKSDCYTRIPFGSGKWHRLAQGLGAI